MTKQQNELFCLFLQHASVTATARALTAAFVSNAVTSPPVLTARPACLVTMATRLMAANARVSAASQQTLVILHAYDLMAPLVFVEAVE